MIRPTLLQDGTVAHVIDGDTHISKWVEESGRLDHDQSVLPLLESYLDGVVVDVGAFIGDHTINYARRARVVHAFEPNPEAFECLRRNLRAFDNVLTYQAGLGSASGAGSLLLNANAGMAALVPGNDIPILALDSLGLSGVTFLKIDAEGWECEVLEGARDTIARCRPVMLVEVNESALKAQGRSPAELLVRIETLRYTLRNVYEGEPMRGPQYDVLCFPLLTSTPPKTPTDV